MSTSRLLYAGASNYLKMGPTSHMMSDNYIANTEPSSAVNNYFIQLNDLNRLISVCYYSNY